MGTLNVYTSRYSDGGNQLLWTTTGNQGQSWIRNYLEIKSSVPFKVFF